MVPEEKIKEVCQDKIAKENIRIAWHVSVKACTKLRKNAKEMKW